MRKYLVKQGIFCQKMGMPINVTIISEVYYNKEQ